MIWLHLFFLLITIAKRIPTLLNLAALTLFLASTQVIFGISTVLTGISTDHRAIHAAIGYALWGGLSLLIIRMSGFQWIKCKKAQPI